MYIHMCVYIYIYIERERDMVKHNTCIHIYIYIYTQNISSTPSATARVARTKLRTSAVTAPGERHQRETNPTESTRCASAFSVPYMHEM